MQPESPQVIGNPRNAMVCDVPYLQNEFGDPCSQTFKKSVHGNFGHECPLVTVASFNTSHLHWNEEVQFYYHKFISHDNFTPL